MPIRKKRKVRPKEKNLPKGYDSKWEVELHETILKKWKHHYDAIDYVIEKSYEVDFSKHIDGKLILLEAKGRFWDHAEYSKYIWIKKALPKDMELVFLFYKPDSPMPGAKLRKDGTKRSHSEWAESQGFRWFTDKTIPKEWIDEV